MLEDSSNVSDRTGSLWFYSKDEADHSNTSFANSNFKSFKYKAKVLGKTEADGENRILRNTTTDAPLKLLGNFW